MKIDKMNDGEMYQLFLEKIKNDECFSYSRFGDGEWNAIFNKIGQNCDGHQYFADMGERLRQVLSSKPKYFLGLQGLAVRQRGDEIFNNYPNDWCSHNVFHRASINKKLNLFFEMLSEKNVVIVGPKYLKEIKKHFSYSDYIIVPDKNCWMSHDKILIKCKELIKEGDIVLFAASMMTNVLIDELHNNKTTLIDIGSVLDPYVGKSTRSYHKKLNL